MSRAGFAGTITIVVACSAGVASAATTATPASFASRADKACTAAGARVVALPVPTGTTVVGDLRANRTIIIKLVSQLRAIKAPAAKAKGYAAFISTTSEQGKIIGETLTAFGAHQSSKLARLGDEAETVGRRSDAQAKALGLPACAKDYSPSAMPSTGTPTTPTTPATTTTTPASTASAPAPTPAASAVPAAAGTTGASGTTGGSAGTAGSTSAGNSSQSGSQNFNGSSSGGQSINTSGGGIFFTG
jgi:hypothetical protein